MFEAFLHKHYRPKTVSIEFLNDTVRIIREQAAEYAERRDQAKQQYDEFMALGQKSSDGAAPVPNERAQVLKERGSPWGDDEIVEVYDSFLRNKYDEEYLSDAARLGAIIAASPGNEVKLTNEIYYLVSGYQRFIRPKQFWDTEGFKTIAVMAVLAAAIYLFGVSNVGWFFIGVSLLFIAYISYLGFSCKSGGCINGIMFLPFIFLLFIGSLMVSA